MAGFLALVCNSEKGTGIEEIPDDKDQTEVPTGASTTLFVKTSGEWVRDTTTGILLSSDRAEDTLVISTTSEPNAAPVDGESFTINSRSGSHLRVGIPRTGDDRVLLYGWGYFSGAGNGRSDSLRWVGIAPENADTDTVVFDIPIADDNGLYRRNASSWSGFSRFSLSVVKAGSSAATTLSNFHVLAARAIIALQDSLESPLDTQVHAALSSTHRYSLTIASSSYYKGLWHILGLTKPRCLVAISQNSSQGSVAHEMGHYFSHVLVGDTRYAELEELAPDGDHGLGDVHEGRTTITEEYAYFTEYFMTGTVNDAADPLAVHFFLGKQVQPGTVDMPSVEGFGTVLLCMLQRSDTTVIDFEKIKDTLPILGASFGELYSVLATGPTTINDLRKGLATLCTQHAFDTGWQICAERAGWSYHGKGKVIDSDGKPVQDAAVFCALTVDTKLKCASPPVKSDAQGIFALPRIFPGKARLYAVSGGDTATVEIDVSWDKETPVAIDLPTITIGALKIASVNPLQAYESDTITLSGKGFGATRGTSYVLFGNKKAVSYPSWSDALIKVCVPNGARPGLVTVYSGTVASNTQPFTVLSGIARDLRKATTLYVSWRGTHEFSGASGSTKSFEAFNVATDEIGTSTPSIIWKDDSFEVAFDGLDDLKYGIRLTVKGKVTPWGDTLIGASVNYTRTRDTCETGGIIPTYSFSYSLKSIRLNDYNKTFKMVQYRVAGEIIAANVANPVSTNELCDGTISYVSTYWNEGVGTTDIEVDFEWE